MVYESDFYTSRNSRTYNSTPRVSSYSVSTPSRYVSRLPLTRDSAPSTRVQEYSYSSSTSSSSGTGGRPVHESRTTERRTETGPYGTNYTTERSSTSGNGPAGYSYSSTASGRLPGGTSYRHFSYKV